MKDNISPSRGAQAGIANSNGNERHKAPVTNRYLINRAIHRSDLISGAKDVLLIIADRAGHGSSTCTASYDTLAEMTGKKRRWMIYIVKMLAKTEWILIGRAPRQKAR